MPSTPPDEPKDPVETKFWDDDPGLPSPDIWDSSGGFDSEKAQAVFQAARRLPNDQKAIMLRYLQSAQTRATVRKMYANPAEIARAVDPNYKITPALTMIADAIERGPLKYPNRNIAVSMPPQEGKSSLVSVWTVLRALQLNPNRRIILATYGSALAEAHSQTCRDTISRHGTGVIDAMTGATVSDKIGLRLSASTNRVSAWKIEGGNGGMVAVGLGGTITGHSADLFIIDDPYKNMQEADSAAHRDKVNKWFSSVATTRLSPAASMILIQTRWHPEDLLGTVITGERSLPKAERSWKYINIPAISQAQIPDALKRPPGVPMESARDGITPEGIVVKRDFPAIHRKVGDRTWFALYQGVPVNPEGGLFQRAWFDPRLPMPPVNPLCSIVGVDPADSGEGDETGIICGSLMHDGTIALAYDWSGQMTADEWSVKAVTLALTTGAREIAIEAYAAATTYELALKRAYRDLHMAAAKKHNEGGLLTPIEQLCLSYQPPFVIYKWRAQGKVDSVGRSVLLRQAVETKRCRTVETDLAVFENQACNWQHGQHQPDRVSAAIIAHDRLHTLSVQQMMLSPTPGTGGEIPPPPDWMRRRIG